MSFANYVSSHLQAYKQGSGGDEEIFKTTPVLRSLGRTYKTFKVSFRKCRDYRHRGGESKAALGRKFAESHSLNRCKILPDVAIVAAISYIETRLELVLGRLEVSKANLSHSSTSLSPTFYVYGTETVTDE